MLIDLSGKKAVIAGASRGLGFSVARRLAQAGAAVSICARNAERLATAHGELKTLGATVHSATCDLADAQSIERYVEEADRALGGIDILVNNATGQASGNTETDWLKCMSVDIMGTVRATRAAQPMLAASGTGCVVNIASRTALRPSPRTQPYGAAKAALMQLTGSQAADLARQGIRVNCVAPGSFQFPGGWWDKCRERKPELYQATLESFPFGRFGTAEDVSGVILFLASPLAGWVSGQTILVDGGQMLGA